jgi:hypothetical protein
MIICRKDAKAQRKAQENETQKLFASLRLCGKNSYKFLTDDRLLAAGATQRRLDQPLRAWHRLGRRRGGRCLGRRLHARRGLLASDLRFARTFTLRTPSFPFPAAPPFGPAAAPALTPGAAIATVVARGARHARD